MAYRIQLRRDTSVNWLSNNPILLQGEFGYESDTGNGKIGDGQTVWASLSYYGGTGPTGSVGPTGFAGPTGSYLVSDIPPGSSAATGATGELALDSDWLYVCVGTDTWKRTVLTSW
jgi:hypothetical protein